MKNAKQCIEILTDMINEQGIERVIAFMQEACTEQGEDTAYSNRQWSNLSSLLSPAYSFAASLNETPELDMQDNIKASGF